MRETFDFGKAIKALALGKCVARLEWVGKGVFVFKQVPSRIPPETIPTMQSLPQNVKDEFTRRGGSIQYMNQLAIVDEDNNISGYSPSASDVLWDDWYILD